jgi:chemotaxis protein methyltransferase CheR
MVTTQRAVWGSADVESLEVGLLLEGIYEAYGYDFRQYSRGSLRRRLRRRMDAEGLVTISALQDRVLHDKTCMSRLLHDLSVNVSSMFRDPSFYLAFRTKVVPVLRTYPFLRIWNAGCSTGEETLSMAILLSEHGLYERARIYATDMNDAVLERARAGVFPIGKMQEYTSNYIQAGGERAFSEYYAADGKTARFDPSLIDNVVFAEHNLVTDRSFNEFHVIMCRNVMIYFDRALQDRVLSLLHDSLVMFGVLALGTKETLELSSYADRYEEFDAPHKLYRRIR